MADSVHYGICLCSMNSYIISIPSHLFYYLTIHRVLEMKVRKIFGFFKKEYPIIRRLRYAESIRGILYFIQASDE